MIWGALGVVIIVVVILWTLARSGRDDEQVAEDVDDFVLHDMANPDDEFDVGQ
jgi:hypothetical protein